MNDQTGSFQASLPVCLSHKTIKEAACAGHKEKAA